MRFRPHILRRTRGFSLIELVATMFVLSLGLPAIAYMYTVALLVDADTIHRGKANFLANSLMNEISSRRFRESATAPGNGPDSGEVSGYDRRNFNDIDDYNEFKTDWGILSPPRDETGTSLTDYSEYAQYVEVVNIAPPSSDLTTRSFAAVDDGSTDIKLVTVKVYWNKNKNFVAVQKVFNLP